MLLINFIVIALHFELRLEKKLKQIRRKSGTINCICNAYKLDGVGPVDKRPSTD